MARGHQKLQAQAKNLEKQRAQKKPSDGRKAAAAMLHYTCAICKTGLGDKLTYRDHFEAKHPKSPLPAELTEGSSSSE